MNVLPDYTEEILSPLPKISTGGEESPGAGGDAPPLVAAPPVDPISPAPDVGPRPAMSAHGRGDASEPCIERERPSGASSSGEAVRQAHPNGLDGHSEKVGKWESGKVGTDSDPTCSLSHLPTCPPAFHRASDICAALNSAGERLSTKTLHRRAIKLGWPMRQDGNRYLYAPPAEIAALLAPPGARVCDSQQPTVRLTSHALSEEAERKFAGRKAAVHFFRQQRERHGVERALVMTVAHFANPSTLPPLNPSTPPFLFSTKSLRRWVEVWELFGDNGLLEQKAGRSGRKPVARYLDEPTKARLKALSHEHGSAARGVRQLMRDPNLHAGLREHLHEGHSSKSYVTPSILKSAQLPEGTAALAQGTRHARLQGRFTPGSYADVKAGQYFCGDDMTSNVLAWCEWPNRLGYLIGQPQILPLIDVGSMRWLVARTIMRAGGQYTGDDVWGLYGDGFDQFGLPEVGFVSEFGHWQSNRVVGHKTGLSDEQRIGGLSSLGLDLIPSFDPRTKVIETAFNQLQYQLDAQPGFAGRDQRKHLPETVKRLRAECESGKRHPKDVFPHVSQLADSVQTAMENINQERGDGMILRGDTPLEKWTADGAGARLRRIPDEARWLYRSAMNVVPVTKNGLRITQGTGHKMVTHYYDGPALHPLPRGEKLSVYWNDHNPEADAILLRHGRYFGTATYVPHLSRFNATDEQLSAEAARKKAALHYARTELRAIQPEMKRCAPVIPVSTSSVEIGRKIADAEDAVTRTAREKANLQRQTAARLAKTPLDWDELGEPSEISNLRSQISEPVAVAARGITEAELNEL